MIIYINLGLNKIIKLINLLVYFSGIVLFINNIITLFIYYEFLLILIILIISKDRFYFERYNLLIYLFIYIILISYLTLIYLIILKF